MRTPVALILGAVLTLSGGAAGGAALAEEDRSAEAERSQEVQTIEVVDPYRSTWDSVARDIASLTDYTDALREQRADYLQRQGELRPLLAALQSRAAELTEAREQLRARIASLESQLAAALIRQSEQEQVVGALARLLYQQPAPEMTALAQLLEGEDLRSFDRQHLVTDVLSAKAAHLEEINAEVAQLRQDLDGARQELQQTQQDLAAATEQRDQAQAQLQRATSALAAIDADRGRAQARIDEIRRAEEARIRAAAAAAAAAAKAAEQAAAAQQAAERAAAAKAAAASSPPAGTSSGSSSGATSGSAQPTGGGTAAVGGGDFSARLPSAVPYRDTFLTYGIRYRVEPALLAAIAYQESGFNAWAGCSRSGGGKGLMQHEGQSQFCGPGAVAASVEKSAIMLAGYYNRSRSWTAAIFAYNNGPGLMDEWVRYSGNPDRLRAVLAAHYNASPWASPGPRAGFSTWGEWRAAVAYSYASPQPLPGFRSATQKWLIYRQG